MKHCIVLTIVAVHSSLGSGASLGTSQSAKYPRRFVETLDQDNRAVVQDEPTMSSEQRNSHEQFRESEIAQYQHQTLLRQLRQAEATEIQAQQLMLRNQQVFRGMQQQRYTADPSLVGLRGELRLNSGIGSNQQEDTNLMDSSDSDSEDDPDSGMIHYKETEKQFWNDKDNQFRAGMITICTYMVTTCLVAILYRECMKRGKPQLEEGHGDLFSHGLFDTNECCGRDLQLCLCSWCCTWIRWADTASDSKVGFLEFYPAAFITALLMSVSTITYGVSGLILVLVVVLCRAHIRRAYGLHSGTWDVLCRDCCVWLFCAPCAAAQEARQVEYIALGGYQQPLDGRS